MMHDKRWHGMVQHALMAGGLWLSTACGEVPGSEQQVSAARASPVQGTRAQSLENEGCSPDVTPPVVSCSPYGGVLECGQLIRNRALNFSYSDACGASWIMLPGYQYTSLGTVYTTTRAMDLAENQASCSTAWTVTDTVAPQIELQGEAAVSIPQGAEYVDEGARYFDACMHPFGDWQPLEAQGTVDAQVPGTYTLTYALTDPSGNQGIPRTRTVRVISAQPTSTLTGTTTQSRLRHTATRLPNGRVLAIGGYSRTAEEYNPATGTWSAVGVPLTTHRGHTATALADGTVLVAGGAKVSSASLEEVYEPASGQWSRTGRMSTVRYDHTAVRLSDGRVLVAGGGTSESSGGALASASGPPPVRCSPRAATTP